MTHNTGTPTPTLTPIINLLLTPPVFSFETSPAGGPPALPVDVVKGGGTYDFGTPDEPVMDNAPFPNSEAANAVTAADDQITLNPDGTTVLRVFVTTFREIVCSDAGQLIRPGDKQAVAL